MMKILFFSFILFHLLHAEAQDRRLAVIRKIQGSEVLPSNLSRQLEKSTLQIVVKQPELELLLTGGDTPSQSLVDAIAIEGEIGKNSQGYSIETRLVDLKTKKLISKASLDNIREEDLLRMYESALKSVFEPFEKAYLEKTNPVPPPPPAVIRPVQKKNPTSTQVNLPDSVTQDFRQRVRDLKMGVDDKIVKTISQKELEEANRKEQLKQGAQSEASKSVNGYSEEKLNSQEGVRGISYPASHSFAFGYENRSVNSTSFIDTSASASLVTLTGTGHFPLAYFSGKVAASYDLGLSRVASAPVEIPILYKFGGYATYLRKNWFISAGLYRDKSFFVNLPSPGGGLVGQDIDSSWMRLKTEFILDFKGPWTMTGAYGVPYQVTTNYSALKNAESWSGSHIHVSLSPPLTYKNFDMAVAFEKINLNSQGERPFTFNESRIALSVRRSL
jgi:hypothetical protein